MKNNFALVIHHKGRWLFDGQKLFRGTWEENQEILCAVDCFLKQRLGAKKYDIAPVEKSVGNMNIHVFVIDISAFFDSIPTFVCAYSKENIPPLSREDTDIFDLAQEHIKECRLATEALLGKEVDIVMDRPVGTHHPKHPHIVYPINYGYIDGMLSADGEGIDVYLLGIHEPLDTYHAKIIAVIRREDDIEDKLAAAPVGMDFSEQEIADAIRFQEQFYRSSVHKTK